MADMTQGKHHAAGAPMRRARFAAWCVFTGMAATSMTFQTYHAITAGQLAWPLAALYGIAPLAISIGVLEFAAIWGVLWAQIASYLIAGGAMYASASATGAVTQHAAAAHTELVFGLILDAAALLAIAFINHGPTAAAVVAAVEAREAELLERIAAGRAEAQGAARNAADAEARLRAELAAERTAKQAAAAEAETALRAAIERAASEGEGARETALRAAAEASRAREGALLQQLQAERGAREIAEQGAARWSDSEDRRISAEAGRASNADQLRSAREALQAANAAREAADLRAAEAEEKAARLTRKLAANAGAPAGSGKARKTDEGAVPNDVGTRAEARKTAAEILKAHPDTSGAELADKCGMSERWGQNFRKAWFEERAEAI
jgi:hypothetical protein